MILFWLSGAFVSGVAAGGLLPALPEVSLVFLPLLVGAARLLRLTRWWVVPIILGATLLGVWRSPHSGTPGPADLVYYTGRSVQVVGTIDAEPDIRDTGANYTIRVDKLMRGSHAFPLSGTLSVHTSRAVQLDYGERVVVRGKLRPIGLYLSGRLFDAQMQYPHLLDEGPSSPGWTAWLVHLRDFIAAGINAWLPEPEAALLIAITLGARSATLGDLAHPLVNTGLIHLVAISGIKVAMVAGIVHQLLRGFAHRFVTLAVSMGALWFYVLLTGLTPSGVRSAIMWSLLFTAVSLGRGTVPLVSLGFAAAVMVGLDPRLIGDLGFQLSVVGTLAIVAFTDPLIQPIRWIPSPWRDALAVTFAAQMGTLPIAALGFHLVSASGPVANMLVLPFLPVLILAGFLLGVVAQVTLLASPLAALTYVVLHLIVLVARTLSSWGGVIPAAAVSRSAIAAYYLALCAVAGAVLRRAKWVPVGSWPARGREFAVTGVVALSALTFGTVYPASGSNTSLIWLGSGNSVLLQSDGATALIDGSPRPLQLLDRLGEELPYDQKTIDLVVVTDPRATNVASLDNLFGHYHIGEVLDVGVEYPSTTYARWRADLRRRHIPVPALRTAVDARIGEAHVTALGPDALYPDPRNCIGLLRVSILGKTFLLAGASSAREQLEAVFRPVRLRSDWLIGAHRPNPEFWHAVLGRSAPHRFRLSSGDSMVRLAG